MMEGHTRIGQMKGKATRHLFGRSSVVVLLLFLGSIAGACQGSAVDTPVVGHCAQREAPPAHGTNASFQTEPFRVERLGEKGLEAECLVVEDLDGDGHVDVVVARKSYDPIGGLLGKVRLWRGQGKGRFVSEEFLFPGGSTPVTGCIAGDMDEDGMLDVLLGTMEGDVAALIQVAPGEFEPVVHLTDLPESLVGRRFTTLVLYDLDGIPPLDLLAGTYAEPSLSAVCPSAEEDRGGGTDVRLQRDFALPASILCMQAIGGRYVLAESGLCPEGLQDLSKGPVWGAVVADFNDDGVGDVIFAGDYAPNIVLMSSGGRGLVNRTSAAGIAQYNHGMGFSVADFDGDGVRDLYVSDAGADQLWGGMGCGVFEDRSGVSQVAQETDRGYGWGVASFDLEQDGDLDIFVANSFLTEPGGWGQEALCSTLGPGGDAKPPPAHFLLLNDGQGHFSNQPQILEAPIAQIRKPVPVSHGDLDLDGDVDLVTIEARRLTVYWNDAVRQGNHLSVVVRDGGSSPAVGARIVVTDGDGAVRWRDLFGTHGRDGHSQIAAHFGLGDEPGPLRVDVRWSDGTWSGVSGIDVNQSIIVQR
jgi:hypothetical protein